jgi:hypothetical protein
MFRQRVSVREGIFSWWYVLLDGRPTGLHIRWTDYSGEAELRTVENHPPTLLDEYANRTEALNAAVDLLEYG